MKYLLTILLFCSCVSQKQIAKNVHERLLQAKREDSIITARIVSEETKRYNDSINANEARLQMEDFVPGYKKPSWTPDATGTILFTRDERDSSNDITNIDDSTFSCRVTPCSFANGIRAEILSPNVETLNHHHFHLEFNADGYIPESIVEWFTLLGAHAPNSLTSSVNGNAWDLGLDGRDIVFNDKAQTYTDANVRNWNNQTLIRTPLLAGWNVVDIWVQWGTFESRGNFVITINGQTWNFQDVKTWFNMSLTPTIHCGIYADCDMSITNTVLIRLRVDDYKVMPNYKIPSRGKDNWTKHDGRYKNGCLQRRCN